MKYYGMYQGIVTNIKDPEKRGRIKVKCPDILGAEVESAWCDPVVTVAYDKGGDFCIPTKDEAVWLLFIAGDVNRPVYLGGWWSKNKTPLGDNYTDIDKVRIINYADCTIKMQNGTIDINIGEGECDLKIEHKKVTIKGDLIVEGKITATKEITSNKDITSDTDVKSRGVSLVEHIHGGVYSGGSNTDIPVKEVE